MKKVFLSLAACGFLLASCGESNETKTEDTVEVAEDQNEAKHDDTPMEKDSEFAVKAANGGMAEVELGRLAVSNAASAEVKKFAQGMIDDHSKVNDELKATAASKNITLPTGVDEDHQKAMADLGGKKGADFDKAYMDMMVDEHKKTIDLFQDEANNGNDADLKAWAAQKVPALQHHLEMAENVKKGLK